MKKFILFTFVIGFIIIFSSYVSYYYTKPDNNNNFENNDMVSNKTFPITTTNIEDIPKADEGEVINQNTTIQYNHKTNGKLTQSITEKASLSLINLTKEQLEETLTDVEVKQFSADLVVLEKNTFKKTSYIVGTNEGFVSIFYKNDDDSVTLYNQTKIPIETLPEEDIKLLEKGIIATDRAELVKIIEDYTS